MRRRIVATCVSVAVFAVALFAIPMAAVLRSRSRQADVDELRRLVVVAASRLPAPPYGPGTPVSVTGHHRLGLYRPDGRLVAGDGPDPGDAVVTRALDRQLSQREVDDEIAVAYAVRPLGGPVAGVLRMTEPLAEVKRRFNEALLGLAGLAAVAAMTAGGAGWILVRVLTRPLDRLREAAVALGDGDFTVKPPATGLEELDDVGSALAEAAERIGRLVERERAFSADASHQLRTPITGLRVTLEAELDAPRPDRDEVLRESLAVVDQLEGTVDGLLRLARDQPLDRGPLDVPRTLAGLRTRWEPRVRARGRRLEVRAGADGLPVTRASAAAVGHVLDVLVENALVHGDGAITVEARAVAGGLSVSVSDEGPGVADPDRAFQRREPGRGSGIGLALGRTLAAAEGADLRLRQARPAVFELVLPGTESPT